MRKIGLILFLLSPATVFAQQMSQQDMQDMMVQVQEVQACMQTIDQNELNKLQEESKKLRLRSKACAITVKEMKRRIRQWHTARK